MSQRVRTIADLPRPRGLPVLGNLHQLLDISTFHQRLEWWARAHGPEYVFDLGPARQIVVLSDRDVVNDVLKARPDTFRRWALQQQIFNELSPLTDGVFLVEGAEWKEHRRLVMAALNVNSLQQYFGAIHTAGTRFHARLQADAARPGFDIAALLHSFTIDITSALVFGQDLNTLERGENELQHHIETFMAMVNRRMGTAVPYWRVIRTPIHRRAERSARAIEAALHGFLESGRARVAADPGLLERPQNLLDGMLAAQQLEGRFTDRQILANIFILLVAGEDTTAHTLSWAAWQLAQHPEVQDALAAEAREVLGDEPFPSDHAVIDRLSYAEAVVKESMRLKPVAPMLPVETLVDTTVGGLRLPAGTVVQLLFREAAQDRSADWRQFRPSRWTDDGPTPPKTLVFGSGPRFCPGRNLALIEMKSALATLARDFTLALDPAAPAVRESLQFTMAPTPIKLRATPRVTAAVTG